MSGRKAGVAMNWRECIIRQENNFTQMGSIILAIRLASIGAHLAVLLDIRSLSWPCPRANRHAVRTTGRRTPNKHCDPERACALALRTSRVRQHLKEERRYAERQGREGCNRLSARPQHPTIYYYDHFLEKDAAAKPPPVACVRFRMFGVYSPSSSESL